MEDKLIDSTEQITVENQDSVQKESNINNKQISEIESLKNEVNFLKNQLNNMNFSIENHFEKEEEEVDKKPAFKLG